MDLNKRITLKNKLKNRDNLFVAWTSIADVQITEIFANAGFDLVGIDIEHGTASLAQCQRIIAAAQAAGSFCLPRIASHNMEMIKRLLDSGADGIIVPSVETTDEVKNIISWMKYPPLGKRSYGVNRAQNYGFNFDDYAKKWNGTSSLIIQIESIKAVKNIDALLAFDEVDGAMVGPYDISGSLGIPGKIEDPKVLEAGQVVVAACKKYGKSCGTQLVDYDINTVKDRIKLGYNFLVLSSDIFLLWKWSDATKSLIRSING